MNSSRSFGCVGSSIRLVSGTYLDLQAPQPSQIHLEDIAHALAMLPRFGGHCPRRYSVAEHSVHCAMQAMKENLPWQTQLACLLHDAAEAYLGDVVKPLKNLLADVYLPLEERFEQVIGEVFDVDFEGTKPDWQRIDRMLLIAERRALFGSDGQVWEGELETQRIEVELDCWPVVPAKTAFLNHFDLIKKYSAKG